MSRQRSILLAVAGLFAVGLVVVGVFLAVRTGPGSGDAGGPAAAAQEMEHIHGIGVDPGDGTVYAGTHYGLFRIADGAATRVSEVQDYMGFTVAGPGHFLASGHPGEGQDGPSSVGLIESTDGGETWETLSLSGEADFHALEFRHDRVYGLNSMTGQLLTSSDKQSWEELSQAEVADFAVSPEGPDELVATTEQGLTRSADGGATFEIVESAPVMVFVSWADDGALAGVTPDGVVYTALEPDGEWTEGASLGGQPEALTIASGTQIYAAANGAVLASGDGGATFSPLLGQ
ncbi:F510_1955 family glycosylhydrolase [Promicromonospora soli]